jgi:hypothetical protein
MLEMVAPAGISRWETFTRRNAFRPLILLICYVAAGVAVTWPLATHLGGGRLPDIPDPASYVWSLWWVAHQVIRLRNPWFTRRLAAPGGVQLGYDTLMPALGTLMLPVTLTAGPVVSYNLLVTLLPGLLCYVLYRVARLWLPTQAGAIAAGALFGLSSMVAWQDWYHLNLAAGTLFLPVALEAAVRLRRRPRPGQAVLLGVVLGLAVLVNQESAIMAVILAALVVIPWAVRQPTWARLRDAVIIPLTAAVVASPQIIAMMVQAAAGGTTAPADGLPKWYRRLGVDLPTLFSPSPRLRLWGLGAAAAGYHFPRTEGIPAFGVTLTVLGLAGLAIFWRRRGARQLALLWLGASVLALGSALKIGRHSYYPAAVRVGGVRLSGLLPFTWLVRLPGLSAFREADRFTLLALVPASLLAGAAVGGLVERARPLLRRAETARRCRLRAVLAAALLLVALIGTGLEAGWAGNPAIGSARAALPTLDAPIAADHSGSIVVDVPFGLRGGFPARYGRRIYPQALTLATADGHPRAISYTSWIPEPTVRAIRRQPFYARLDAAQFGHPSDRSQARLARADARRLDIGWVLLWRRIPGVMRFLAQVGYHFGYRADHVSVYRPPPSWHRPSRGRRPAPAGASPG